MLERSSAARSLSVIAEYQGRDHLVYGFPECVQSLTYALLATTLDGPFCRACFARDGLDSDFAVMAFPSKLRGVSMASSDSGRCFAFDRGLFDQS